MKLIVDNNFDAKVLSETQYHKRTYERLKVETIDDFQSCFETIGRSIKSGCVFFVKEDLRFQHFSLSFDDDENERKEHRGGGVRVSQVSRDN